MISHLGKCSDFAASRLLRTMRRRRRLALLALPLVMGATLAGAIDGVTRAAPSQTQSDFTKRLPAPVDQGDLSVLTYNVKGLPWPLASGRPVALARIADRLAEMRHEGRQPHVVVLQEAFTPEAKAIGRRAGYPFVIEGPYARSAPDAAAASRRDWHLGETQPAAVDSGLVLLSDLPVVNVERVAFAPEDCAGFDCLAAKGVLLVTLEVPGRGQVVVATTHLNCQGASGAPKKRTTQAFGRQIALVGNLLARARSRGMPVVVAGDFNQGQRPQRIALLHAALDRVQGVVARDSLSRRDDADPQDFARNADLDKIREHARDLQFAFDGGSTQITPTAVDIPFGRELDGSMLSDHMGYTVHYRVGTKTTLALR